MDLSKLSDSDLRALRSGDLTKMSSEGLGHLKSQSSLSPPAQGSTPSGPAQTGLESFANTATLGYLPQLQAGLGSAMGLGDYTKLRDDNIARQRASAAENPKSNIAGKVAGFGANMLMGPGGIPGITAQAALANPGDTPGQSGDLQLGDRAKNAALAALFGKTLQLAGKGGAMAGDRLMQSAVNIRKPVEGMGKELIDQGLIGTQGMMRNQANKKIASLGEDLSHEAGSISGDISTEPIVQRLQNEAGKYKVNGKVPPNLQADSDQYSKLAEFLQGNKSLSPSDLLEFKQKQGDFAFAESGNPLQSGAARAARTASGEAGDALKNAYAAQNALDDPNKIADLNKSLSALYKAKSGMSRGASLSGLAGAGGLGLIGGLLGGAPGAAAGAAMKTSLAQSALAHLADKAGSAAGPISPEAARFISLFPPAGPANK